jgi:hypothetical protein
MIENHRGMDHAWDRWEVGQEIIQMQWSCLIWNWKIPWPFSPHVQNFALLLSKTL